MTNISVEEKINLYLQKNPDLKNLEREALVSVMVQNGAMTMTEAQKVSAFAKSKAVATDMGTMLEHTEKPVLQGVQAEKTVLTAEQAKDLSVEYLSENVQSALNLYRNADNGVVSEAYDGIKNILDTELSSKNVGDVINKEVDCLNYLTRAKEGSLTKREYYEQNKERLREMIMKRFNEKDDTGVSYLNKFRGNISEKEYAQILEDYIQHTIDTIPDMQGIKDAQHNLIISDEAQTADLLANIANGMKTQESKEFFIEGQGVKFESPQLKNHPYESDELMTFEETFALERGREFSKEAFEALQQSKGEMSFATGAHNKTQELRNGVKQFMDEYNAAASVHTMSAGTAGVTMTTGGREPDAAERAGKISEFFSEYYAMSPESGKKDLDFIIEKQKLDLQITRSEDGTINIEFGGFYKTDAEKNKALNTLMRVSVQEQDKKLNNLLGGKTYESYLETYQNDYKSALGAQNADELAKAMSDDQMTVVEKYSGIAQMSGMGLMIAGGILSATPAAPAGAGMLSLGGKIALCGMAAKNVLGFTEELTRENTSDDRMTRLKKNLAMDIGGLIIGGAAGRQGMKYASQILQNGGNKALAMVAEKGTDFTLSVAGDLAMVGALNYDEGIAETLKNNGIGIVVSTFTGLKASKEMFRGEFDIQPQRVSEAVKTSANVKSDSFGENLSQTASAQSVSGKGAPDIQGTRKPETPRGPVLEGGIHADELDEVAPFAEKLQKTPHAGDYIDVPITRLERKEFKANLRSLCNYKGEPFINDYTINHIIKMYDEADIPKLNQLVTDMKTKFKDNEYTAQLFKAFVNNKTIQKSKDFNFVRNLINEFKDSHDNRININHIAYFLNDKQKQAIEILLDMNEIRFNNAEDLRNASYNFDERNSLAALKRVSEFRNANGERIFTTDDINEIIEMKHVIAGKNFTDDEIIKLHEYMDDFTQNISITTFASVLSSGKNPALVADIKAAINADNISDILPRINEAAVPYCINSIADKTLKSLVKKNINNIQDPADKLDFLDRMSYFYDLSEVQDKYILSHIAKNINEMSLAYKNRKKTVNFNNFMNSYKYNITEYIDIDKGLSGKDSYTYGSASEYLSYMKSEYPERAAAFLDLVDKYQTLTKEEYFNYINNNKAIQKLSLTDFIEVEKAVPFYVKDKKIEALKTYFEDNYHLEKNGNPDTKKLLSYMYKNNYLSTLPKETAQLCENIYDSFGVKVFVSDENDTESIRLIQNELMEWQRASKGEAVMPPVLDLSVIRQNYINKKFASGGFHVHGSHNIALNGENLNNIQHAIRHELAHANDEFVLTYSGQIPKYENGKLIEVIDIDKIIVHEEVPQLDADGNPVFDVYGNPVMEKKTNPDGTFVPDFSKCQYVDEFRNAGVAESQIAYAYNNKAEFLAVAAEGAYTTYSKEFKELLVKMGLPKWMFDMKSKYQVKTEANIYNAGDLSKNYSVDERAAVSRNAEAMFSEITRKQNEIKSDYSSLGVKSYNCRVKDLLGINEKIYRQLAKIDEKISELKDVDKFNAEKLKKGDKPLTREEADILTEHYNIQKHNLIQNYDTVHNTIQDGFGARLVMDDTSPAAVAKVHRNLLDAIDSGQFKILEINNYQGVGGIPYFSSAQIKQIQDHCRRQGYTVTIISDVNAPKGKEAQYSNAYHSGKAVKRSGYTTCQMNILHKNGIISEFQIRGKHINELAESEHIFYDISEGKDVSRGNSAIKQLVSPLEEAVYKMAPRDSDGNLIKPLTPEYTAYGDYLTESYKHARNIELGIPSKKPVLPPNISPLLDIDNIMDIHAKIDYIKKTK